MAKEVIAKSSNKKKKKKDVSELQIVTLPNIPNLKQKEKDHEDSGVQTRQNLKIWRGKRTK